MRAAALLAFVALSLTACASSRFYVIKSADEARTGACEQRTPEIFAISGAIDTELATCVRETFAETTRELILDTEGGSVEAALDIVKVLEGRRLTMRVEGECNSSCANYFLPVAGRIVVGPKGMVLLHGSMDPWTLENWRSKRAEFIAIQAAAGRTDDAAEKDFVELISLGEKIIALQAEFAERHNVSPGWLMYRTPGSGQITGLSHTPQMSRAILVEEPMMRSCLPGVEIEPFQSTYARHWTRSWRRLGLFWMRVAPSGSTVCVTRPAG